MQLRLYGIRLNNSYQFLQAFTCWRPASVRFAGPQLMRNGIHSR